MPFDGTEYTGDPILAVIDRVDELICDEEHWFQGTVGRTKPMRNAGGNGICPILAFNRIEGGWGAEPYFYRAVKLQGNYPSIPVYNNADERTFPEIKALIRKARELRLADIMETVDA